MTQEFDPNRDYVGEMRRKVDELAQGTYFPPLVARKIVADLRESDPGLLMGWLTLQAEEIVRVSINRRDQSKRGAARHHYAKSVFAAAAAKSDADGDTTRMQRWLNAPFSLSTGARVVLRDMRREDLVNAAMQYETRAQTQALMASFLNALARQVGSGKVSDRYSEDELAAMWQSLPGN